MPEKKEQPFFCDSVIANDELRFAFFPEMISLDALRTIVATHILSPDKPEFRLAYPLGKKGKEQVSREEIEERMSEGELGSIVEDIAGLMQRAQIVVITYDYQRVEELEDENQHVTATRKKEATMRKQINRINYIDNLKQSNTPFGFKTIKQVVNSLPIGDFKGPKNK